MRTFNLIYARTLDRGIGYDNKLPWYDSCDLKNFKNVTEGNIVIKPGINKYAYLIRKAEFDEFRVDKTVGLFVKYSSKRLSPWRYSIYKDEQEEIELLKAWAESGNVINASKF